MGKLSHDTWLTQKHYIREKHSKINKNNFKKKCIVGRKK
jgi:hypothetical protein